MTEQTTDGPDAIRHAGFVALLGAPNAGKSTLLNQLMGRKLAIVSPKPQTTRACVKGVLTEGATQIVFIDTPGIFAPQRRLDRAMVQAAWQAQSDADVFVVVIDATKYGGANARETDAILEVLRERGLKASIVLNKIDALRSKAALLPLAEKLDATGVASEIFMVSAQVGDGVDGLKQEIARRMPEGPWLFPEDQLSDLPERLLAAETTREQAFIQLNQELPYGIAVIPESWETKKDGSVTIHQTILVAREGHRPIVLGKDGARIKSIGEAARHQLENIMGHRVHLFLDVKYDKNWQERPDYYRLFGLEFTPEK
ncbi:MAG: GTPase Era [Bdellovibrionales bacterium]